jgi:uncharacterized protein
MVIEGGGMDLVIVDENGSKSVELHEKFEPFSFSGDLQVSNTLADGPLKDFNLMVRRDWAESTLTIDHLSMNESHTLQWASDDIVLGVVCLSESLHIETAHSTFDLQQHECIISERFGGSDESHVDGHVTLSCSAATPALAAIIRLRPRAPST